MYDTGQHFCTEDLRFYEEKKSHTVNKKKNHKYENVDIKKYIH